MDRQEYLNSVSEQIRCKRAIPYIKKELEEHIEDQKVCFVAQGLSDFDAEKASVLEMGDPVETGVMLDQVHRPKMEWRVIGCVILLGILGIVIQGMILSFGVSKENALEMGILVSELRQQIIETVAGIGIMLFICYLDYSVLVKKSRNLWIFINIMMLLSSGIFTDIFTNYVNGGIYYAVYILYLSIPFYAAIVYYFRGQKEKGFIKSLACLIVFLILASTSVNLDTLIIYYVIDLFVLCMAVLKGWFGNEKRRYVIMMGIAVVPVIIKLGMTGKMVQEYLALQGEQIVIDDFVLNRISEYINGGNALQMDRFTITNWIRSDYVWRFIFEYMGMAAGVAMLALVAGFIYWLIRMTRKQKNQFGYIISVGCVMFILLQTVLYLAGNFAMSPNPYLGTFMPFLSNGTVVNAVTYLYMGILLSVYRNTNVVRN